MRDLRLRLLGGFEAEGVHASRLGSRKARVLLQVLALARGRPVSTDRLSDCLWGDHPPSRPAEQVAVLVSRLRRVLGSDRLARSDAGYSLAVDWLDVDALAELTGEAERRLIAGSHLLASAAATAALALARGPLLPEEPDAEWATADRAAAARLVARARHSAGRAALALGEYSRAVDVAAAARDGDPYDEEALRLLMAAYAAGGRPASALASYARSRRRLVEDLGVDPAPATEAMHAAILRQEPLPGVVVGEPPTGLASKPLGTISAPALVGRDDELAALDAALQRVTADDRLEVVVLEGEAGIGKTRLLTVWSERAARTGARVLRGRGDELGDTLPLQPLLDALDAHLRALDADRATALLGAEAAVLEPLLVGRDAPSLPATGPLPDPAAAQALLFGALLSVITRLSREAPAVLVVDDVHLAGPSTLAWLAFALRRAEGGRVLVVAARRSEEGTGVPATTRIVLHPLERDAVEILVGPERAALLHARSGGNPLFLTELAAAASHEALPASLLDAVAARCDRAGPAAPTLRAAAIIGPTADLDVLAAVVRRAPVELLDHLEEGVRRRFLEERGGGFVFRHELVREALAAGVGAARRAVMHREAGRALAARTDSDPLEVARHARLGGDFELAVDALVRAAEISARRYDYPHASHLLDQALELADSPSARLARARVRLSAGRYREAGDDASAALAGGAGAPALEVAALVAHVQRDYPTARRLADDGASLAQQAAQRTACLVLAGRVCEGQGDLPAAEARLTEAVALAPPPLLPTASRWLGTLRAHQGRPAEALLLLTAPPAVGAVEDPFGDISARQFVPYSLALLGRAADALAALDHLEEQIEERHAVRYRPRPDNFRAWILRNLGCPERAEELNQRAVEKARGLGLTEPQAHGILDLAESRLSVGELERAEAFLAEADSIEGAGLASQWRWRLRARLLRARLALGCGGAAEAEEAAAAVAEDAARIGASRYLVLARLLVARARAGAGRPVEPSGVAPLLEQLDVLAGVEAWWRTAEMAAALGVDAWWAEAERRLDSLCRAAGPHVDALQSYAATRLDRIRTSGASA